MSDKRYTAREMRIQAKKLLGSTTGNMLFQAACAEEELANLKTTSGELEEEALEYAGHGVSSPLLTNTIKRLIAERNSLKARLEAVAKECDAVKWDEKIYVTIDTSTAAVDHNKDIDSILRVARGESENK